MKSLKQKFLLILLLILPFSAILAQNGGQPCIIEASIDGEVWLPGTPTDLGPNSEAIIRILPNPDFPGATLLSAKLDLVSSDGGRNSKVIASWPFKKLEDGTLEAKMGRTSGTAGRQITYVVETIKVKQGKKVGLAKLPIAKRTFMVKM